MWAGGERVRAPDEVLEMNRLRRGLHVLDEGWGTTWLRPVVSRHDCALSAWKESSVAPASPAFCGQCQLGILTRQNG